MKNKITIFFILETRNQPGQNCSEAIYIDCIYKNSKKNKKFLDYFGFNQKHKILYINKKIKNICSINAEIKDKIEKSIEEYDGANVLMQLFFMCDNDKNDFGEFVLEKKKNIIKQLEHEDFIKENNIKYQNITFLIPNKGSQFEEFIYYHIPDIKKSYCCDNASKNTIKKHFDIDDIKGKNTKKVFDKKFNNEKKCMENINLLKTNLKKYNSIYMELFKIKIK